MRRVIVVTAAVVIAAAVAAIWSRSGEAPDGIVRANERLAADVPIFPGATLVVRRDAIPLYFSEGELAPFGSRRRVEAVESVADFTAPSGTDEAVGILFSEWFRSRGWHVTQFVRPPEEGGHWSVTGSSADNIVSVHTSLHFKDRPYTVTVRSCRDGVSRRGPMQAGRPLPPPLDQQTVYHVTCR